MHFNTKKAVQAAGVLLRAEGGVVEYIRLLKLLYLADRESIQETGRPITFARPFAMDHGPTPSEIYDLIKGERADEAEWSRYIQMIAGKRVRLAEDPGRGKLSRYEIAKLNEMAEKFAQTDTWDLIRAVMHALPEWEKNRPDKGSSRQIPMGDVIDAVGRGADKEKILDDWRAKAALDQFFAGAST